MISGDTIGQSYHIILLCTSQKGMQNLNHLISDSNLRYFYRHPLHAPPPHQPVPRGPDSGQRLRGGRAVSGHRQRPAAGGDRAHRQLVRLSGDPAHRQQRLHAPHPARRATRSSCATSTAKSSLWAKSCTSLWSPPATCISSTPRTPSTAPFCRQAWATTTATTSRPCTSRPPTRCWRSSATLEKKRRTRWSSTPRADRGPGGRAPPVPQAPRRARTPSSPIGRRPPATSKAAPGAAPGSSTAIPCPKSSRSGWKRSWAPSSATAFPPCIPSRRSW